MRGKSEVGLSAFAFLFSEFIQYSQQRVNTAEELERKLEDAGVGVGRRVLELGCLREKSSKRETRMLGILNFITSVVWKMLFGNAADSLEKSVDREDEFMIIEKSPIVCSYISSAPCSCAAFVAGIVRGVLEGAQVMAPGTCPPTPPPTPPTRPALVGSLIHDRRSFLIAIAHAYASLIYACVCVRSRSGQFPASVSAHDQDAAATRGDPPEDPPGPIVRTVILIRFAPEVLEREKRIAS